MTDELKVIKCNLDYQSTCPSQVDNKCKANHKCEHQKLIDSKLKEER